ncbi:Cell division septum initiation DivIVA, interacts with FtsZ, MinD [Streptomyces sp. LamerLS-316]|uniref:cell division initiation protein n=1 Tax=unclassified Streptomyces TaxID=2593676 RepID=UPI00082391A3|nr:cell division initiation protein [Streptomyces sp. LamerLS-316]MYQ37050.1 cell division initiation protein [Streptomyces sp. SID4921]SCK24363.1 Cell division septum initiation DivIVA, interacts with FtsZ, MinD [Streptomyces sp. LamerLS-316]
MDVQKKLDEIVETVGNARSMPMSASCVVNRAELLAMLEEVREALPGSLAHAEELIGGREQLVEQARQEAERIIESARAERGSLISGTEIAQRSQAEADRILSEARREADEVRGEADEYVDSKLANFEVVLTKTIGSVDRGREKLLGRSEGLDEQGYEDPDFAEAPERSADPETLRRRADDYVDTKLGAFEAVLAKTLEAVGRGRQKLHGRVATDELGAHMAAQDAAGGGQHTSDEDHWAGLAELATPDPHRSPQQPSYAEPAQPDYAPVADYQDPAQTGFPVQGQPEPQYAQTYGYQDSQQQLQADPYAAYQQQPDAYGAYQQQAYDPNQQQEYWPQQGQIPAQQGESALDETSLFDTSMIDLEQLRRYEQGR